MCGTYEEIREQLIDAAIVADMRQYGFLLAGGEFVREHTEGGSPTVLRDRVPARGGGTPADQLVDPLDDRSTFSPAALYAQWEQRFTELFAPFLTMPDPADFTALAERLWEAMADVSPGVPQEREVYVPPTPAMSRFLDQGCSWLHDMNGDTVETFMARFGGRVDDVSWALFGVLNEVHRAARVESGIWQQARSDFSTMIVDSLEVMQSLQGGGGGLDWSLVSAVTQEVTSVTSFFPPTSFISAVASTYADMVAGLSERETTPTSAGSAEEVYRSLASAGDALRRHIRENEQAVAVRLRGLAGQVATNDGHRFCLPRPAGLVGEHEIDDLVDPRFDRHPSGEFRIDPARCRTVGRDMMQALAAQLDGAGAAVEAATGPAIWSRHPELGRGSIGPYSEVSLLSRAISDSLRRSSVALADAGEHLGIAADIAEHTDAEVERRLLRHTRRVAAEQYRLSHPVPVDGGPPHVMPVLEQVR